ncbi:hypothetical protein ZOSMA_6G01940 [Zostera marina]|uniref:Uncharacterized protein n=1 Tax=Zostera marina TaxID=29655 RepID=A0A0K9NR64_ZOSMR|nr:hypothetical protein ZOSMA_6G01940 [Zostera marina]
MGAMARPNESHHGGRQTVVRRTTMTTITTTRRMPSEEEIEEFFAEMESKETKQFASIITTWLKMLRWKVGTSGFR